MHMISRLKIRFKAVLLMPILMFCLNLNSSALANNHPSIEREYMSAAIRGDLSHDNDIFAGMNRSNRSLFDQELQKRFEARFKSQTDLRTDASENAFINQLVKTYQGYWIQALTRRVEPEHAHIELKQQLAQLLIGTDLDGSALDGADLNEYEQGEVFDRISSAVKNAGFHASMSYTPPLHDLIVWKEEKRAEFNVDLTDGEQNVSVVFMDGFASQRWSHFATLGMQAISGWAGNEELYCVVWAYEQSSEKFRVSYLQHEARHFADYRKFPDLDEEGLEYRAKLTELAFAGSSTSSLLRQFTEGSNDQGVSAHARANRRIAQDMYREIFSQELPEHQGNRAGCQALLLRTRDGGSGPSLASWRAATPRGDHENSRCRHAHRPVCETAPGSGDWRVGVL